MVVELSEDNIYNITFPIRFYENEVEFIMVDNGNENIIKVDGNENINNNNGTLTITFYYEFKNNDDFDCVLNSNLDKKLMWRGKLFITDQNNLQNYKINLPNVNGVVKI